MVLARERAELGEVEDRVARLEGIHRPRDHLDALIETVIALRFLERLGEAAAAIRLAHGEHVGVVPEVIVVDADEPEDEPRGVFVTVGVTDADVAAVVRDGEE